MNEAFRFLCCCCIASVAKLEGDCMTPPIMNPLGSSTAFSVVSLPPCN